MIVNADAKSLEWIIGTFLSQDKVAIEEIKNKVDQHTHNQNTFNLPSRLIAKIFVFRLMYGGSAYSYANDPDFTSVSTSKAYWQKVIDAFYEKYKGFRDWHIQIVQDAMRDGKLIMPTGRIYTFEPKRNFKGDLEAPETIIKNYPVQGLGADIMCLARISFANRFKQQGINGVLVNTVHDSIVCDIHPNDVQRTVNLFHEVFDDLPQNFTKYFGVEFNLPMSCEVGVGKNMKELIEVKRT